MAAPAGSSTAPSRDTADTGVPVPAAKGPGGLDTDALRRSWPDVLAKLFEMRRSTWTFVSQNAQVADYDGQRVLLTISTSGLATTFRRGPHAEYVRQALIDVLGVDARVEGVPADQGTAAVPSGTGLSPEDGQAAGPPVGATAAPEIPGPPPSATLSPPDPGPPPPEPPTWSEAPPSPETAPSWASPMERARATVAEEGEAETERVADDSAVSVDDESVDDGADVGVSVVERILGGTVVSEEER